MKTQKVVSKKEMMEEMKKYNQEALYEYRK